MNDRRWIEQGHNALVSAVGFYGQALAELATELSKAEAARLELSQRVVVADQRIAAAESERDDLRSELCALRAREKSMQATIKAGDDVRRAAEDQLKILSQAMDQQAAVNSNQLRSIRDLEAENVRLRHPVRPKGWRHG